MHTKITSLFVTVLFQKSSITFFLPLSSMRQWAVHVNMNDASMTLGKPDIVWDELHWFLDILASMATVSGFNRDDF